MTLISANGGFLHKSYVQADKKKASSLSLLYWFSCSGLRSPTVGLALACGRMSCTCTAGTPHLHGNGPTHTFTHLLLERHPCEDRHPISATNPHFRVSMVPAVNVILFRDDGACTPK